MKRVFIFKWGGLWILSDRLRPIGSPMTTLVGGRNARAAASFFETRGLCPLEHPRVALKQTARMGLMPEALDVTCPCCQALLKIDPETGTVVWADKKKA